MYMHNINMHIIIIYKHELEFFYKLYDLETYVTKNGLCIHTTIAIILLRIALIFIYIYNNFCTYFFFYTHKSQVQKLQSVHKGK